MAPFDMVMAFAFSFSVRFMLRLKEVSRCSLRPPCLKCIRLLLFTLWKQSSHMLCLLQGARKKKLYKSLNWISDAERFPCKAHKRIIFYWISRIKAEDEIWNYKGIHPADDILPYLPLLDGGDAIDVVMLRQNR